MTVADLIAHLHGMPQSARVLFDTEGGSYRTHLIEVDHCMEIGEVDRDIVVLRTDDPHMEGE